MCVCLLSSLYRIGAGKEVAQILSHKRTTTQIVLVSPAGTYPLVILPCRCVSIGNASSTGSAIRETWLQSWLKINGAGFEVNELFRVLLKRKRIKAKCSLSFMNKSTNSGLLKSTFVWGESNIN